MYGWEEPLKPAAGPDLLSFLGLPCPPGCLQVLDWMQNPVPASQYSPPCRSEAELLSNLPGGKLCVMPAAGCGHVSGSVCKLCGCSCRPMLPYGSHTNTRC